MASESEAKGSWRSAPLFSIWKKIFPVYSAAEETLGYGFLTYGASVLYTDGPSAFLTAKHCPPCPVPGKLISCRRSWGAVSCRIQSSAKWDTPLRLPPSLRGFVTTTHTSRRHPHARVCSYMGHLAEFSHKAEVPSPAQSNCFGRYHWQQAGCSAEGTVSKCPQLAFTEAVQVDNKGSGTKTLREVASVWGRASSSDPS